MRVLPFSLINPCSSSLKLLLSPKVTFKSLSSSNLALDSPIAQQDSVSAHSPFPKLQQESSELRRIKSILARRGWKVDSNEFNVVRILNDLFEESFDASLVFYFFRWSESCIGLKHQTRSVCRMTHILVSGNLNHRAVELVRHLVRSSAGERRHRDLLFRVIHETHSESKVLEIVYSMLVDCYIKENMVDVALEAARSMKHFFDIFPSIGVCNALLGALLKLDVVDLAWDLWGEMQCKHKFNNISILTLFIHKWCQKGDIAGSWKRLMAAKRNGIRPDVVVYTIIIDSLCKSAFLKEGTALLFKMIQEGISCDSVSVSSVIDGYCKRGKSDEALNLLKIFSLPPNICIYNSFILNLCRDGHMVEASNLLLKMLDSGLTADCCSYTAVMGGYCKIKAMNKALEYLGKMLKQGIRPSLTTYTLLIDSYCKLGDMEMAKSLFQMMETEGLTPDIVAYNTLMDGYGKQGHLQKAYKLLHTMRCAGISPDIVTYNTLIHSLATRGFMTQAKAVLEELIRRGFSPDLKTVTNVIVGLSKTEKFEEAFFLWSYMSEHHEPDVVTCSALLYVYCRLQQMDKASALFQKMLDIGLIPDLILYNNLIHGFCSVGDFDRARDLLDMMVEHEVLPNDFTYRALVIAFTKKHTKCPKESAACLLQNTLLKYNLSVNIADYMQQIGYTGGRMFSDKHYG